MSHHRRSRGRGLIVALTVVFAVACSGGGEDETSDGTALDTAEADDDEGDSDVADTDAGRADGAAAAPDDGDGDGPAEHRPADGGPSDRACADANDDTPGATIHFPPDGDEAGASPVTVEIVGCSNTFEANLGYEVFHGDNNSPTLEGFTSGGTLGDWAAFGFEEMYWTPGKWRVVVFEDDVQSGARDEYDAVTFVVAPN